MQQKPSRWNISPALIAPEARSLWKDVAFAAPLWPGAGKGMLLNSFGLPINLTPTTNSPIWRGTPYGSGLSRVAGTADQRILRFAGDIIKTSNGAGTGDFSSVVVANPKAAATRQYAYSQRNAATNQIQLAFNASASDANTSGSFAFTTYDAAYSAVAAAGIIDGGWHCFGGVRRSGFLGLWLDGVLRGSASLTVRNINHASNESVIGGVGGVTSGFGILDDTTIVFAAGWNRALSDAEMRMLARDAFCMFRPAAEWRGVWTPSGGGAVLSPVDLSDEFGFETPGIAQAHILSAADVFFAEKFETPGVTQAHLFSPQEMNFAAPFDTASLALESPGAPGFRSRAISGNTRSRAIDANTRSAPKTRDERSKLITE